MLNNIKYTLFIFYTNCLSNAFPLKKTIFAVSNQEEATASSILL